jgi:hypothetical protein
MTTQPGATLSGRVAIDASGATPLPDLTTILVTLQRLQAPSRASANTSHTILPYSDGTFSLAGIAPGKYRLTAALQSPGMAPAWLAHSSVVAGRDALDVPLEIRIGDAFTNAVITMTDRRTEVDGVLRDAANAPTGGYLLVAFSTDRRHWTAGSRRVMGPIRPGADGRFVVRGLPAGEYFLAAATDLEPADMEDVRFLAELAAQAMRITIADGEKKTQDIKIGR